MSALRGTVLERVIFLSLQILDSLISLSFSIIPLLSLLLPISISLGLLTFIYLKKRRGGGSSSSPPPLVPHPEEDLIEEPSSSQQLRSFLSSLKIFGVFEDASLSQLAQKYPAIKLHPHHILWDLDSAFYLVNQGEIDLFAGKDLSEENRFHQVQNGGTVASLFNILFKVCNVPLIPCQVSAKASRNGAEVIRVPFEVFELLEKENPAFITQLIQVALTRFQRVTFITFSRYFGLSSEFLDQGGPKTIAISKGPEVLDGDSLGPFVIQKLCSEMGFPEEVLPEELIHFEEFRQGDILLDQNEAGGKAFIILEGEVEVSTVEHSGRRQILKTGQAGDFVGHWSFIIGCPSFFQIKATRSCRAACIPKKCFEGLMVKTPRLWAIISRKMLEQLSPLVRQIDFALEWEHFRAGTLLCNEGEEGDKIYVVLNGRLRAQRQKPDGGSEFVAEFTAGDAFGDVDALTQSPRSTTVHAVRDTEVALISKELLSFLALRFPQTMIQISRHIALKTQATPRTEVRNSQHRIRTVALLPISNLQQTPFDSFAQNLLLELNNIGPSTLIDGASVLQQLGRNALTSVGKLKLSSWLEEQEETHRIVLFKADRAGTPWMERCVRQADCILFVALADGDPHESEVERFLRHSGNTVRKEIVLLHESRSIAPGTTLKWLQNRPWIKMHHQVLMPVGVGMRRQNTLQTLRVPSAELRFEHQDFARLARHLTRRSVALVLGGGGARGMAHIGFIKALEEAGIPVDLIGGTSVGAFLGGLYARDLSTVSILGWALKFCSKMSSRWFTFWDLTYPVAAWSTGKAFNRVLKQIFFDQQIEDLWLNYFCVTTNISKSRLEVHRSGCLWRYCRASMSLCGFLPPVCDQGDMLVDGGYINNLPVDVMKDFSGAKRIIAIDVALSSDPEPASYGDTLSGWRVLFNRLNPFAKNTAFPTMAEVQSRLAYVSCAKSLQEVKKLQGCFYVQPPLHNVEILGFEQGSQILEAGYRFGKETIEQWRKEGHFSEFLDIDHSIGNLGKRRYSR